MGTRSGQIAPHRIAPAPRKPPGATVRAMAKASEPDLNQLPIDVAEGAIANRTPPESLPFIGI
jgi:hypothetical protein